MTGKKLFDMLLLGVMTISTLVVIGIFYYTEKIYKKPPINEDAEKNALFHETSSKQPPIFFKIDKMILSLVPKEESYLSRMRYLEVELHLGLFKKEDEVIMKENLPVIKDKMITISSKMGADELNSLTGKLILEDRLKKAINKSLGEVLVKSIFFSHYIVQ